MRIGLAVAICFLTGGLLLASPSDKYSITHSTFIQTSQTWSDVALTSNTVRQGDSLAYIVVTSTSVEGAVTVYDGLDSGGAVVAEVFTHESGYFPFEVRLASSSNQVTINKTGTGGVGLTFYITHPVY